MKKSLLVIGIVVLVLFLDQWLKIWVKTNMTYGEEFGLLGLPWARIHFVENDGMAFGLELGGKYGKLALSLFRILAVGLLVYYLRMLIRSGASWGLLTCFSLILAGAIGNILDSAFYGLIFSESYFHEKAVMFPEKGYAGFLYGKVVDMFYFPIFKGVYPEWIPRLGGKDFLFFRSVFNIADASISVGVISILLFQRRFFSQDVNEASTNEAHTEEGTLQSDTTLNSEQPQTSEKAEEVVDEDALEKENLDQKPLSEEEK